jgi:hypothetical protein
MWKSKDLWQVPHAYIRQRSGHTGPTCLMDIATPTGLAQVSVKDPERKDHARRHPRMCYAMVPVPLPLAIFAWTRCMPHNSNNKIDPDKSCDLMLTRNVAMDLYSFYPHAAVTPVAVNNLPYRRV